MENIYLACDHAAYTAKEEIKGYLSSRFNVVDLGTDSEDRVDYPTFGKKIALAVLEHQGRGIALCGSGIGIQIQVNRFVGIRGALCRDVQTAQLSRAHNDSNILCLAGRLNTIEELKTIVDTWLSTEFEAGRHLDRIKLLDEK